jgi:hypothetical protein
VDIQALLIKRAERPSHDSPLAFFREARILDGGCNVHERLYETVKNADYLGGSFIVSFLLRSRLDYFCIGTAVFNELRAEGLLLGRLVLAF